jgi:hypothetical protein
LSQLVEELGLKAILRVDGPRSLEGTASPASGDYREGLKALAASQFGEAEAALRRAVKADPWLPDAVRELGILLAERGRYSEAIPFLSKALDLFGEDRDALFGHGQCLEHLGNTEEAKSTYRVFLRRHAEAPVRMRQLVEKRLKAVERGKEERPRSDGSELLTAGEIRFERQQQRSLKSRALALVVVVVFLCVAPGVFKFFTTDPDVLAYVNDWAGVKIPFELGTDAPPSRPVWVSHDFLLWAREGLSKVRDVHARRLMKSLPLLSTVPTASEDQPAGGYEMPALRLDYLVTQLTREGTRPAVLALAILLNNEDEGVATRAVTALASIGTPGAKEKLKIFVSNVSRMEDAGRYVAARRALEDFKTTPNSLGAGDPGGGKAGRAKDLIRMARENFGISF